MRRKSKSRARGRLPFVRSRRTTNRLQLRATSTLIFELTSPSSDVTSVAWFEETKLWRWRARVNESGATQQLDTVVLSSRVVSCVRSCDVRFKMQDCGELTTTTSDYVAPSLAVCLDQPRTLTASHSSCQVTEKQTLQACRQASTVTTEWYRK